MVICRNGTKGKGMEEAMYTQGRQKLVWGLALRASMKFVPHET
jgi:hypothetical protein